MTDREIAEWARQTLEAARVGEFDLRDLGRAMNGVWDQDFPAAALTILAAQVPA